MRNIYFPDKEITENDLYFVCYMIERTAQKLHQHNSYVAEELGLHGLRHQLSVANVNHSANPLQVEQDWIDEYDLHSGDFDVTNVDRTLAEAILRVYSDDICQTIDNYNCSAYYEPSYVIARAYHDGGF